MAYIARTDGGSEVLELRQGMITDISEAGRSNWREVVEQTPNFDVMTQVRGAPSFVVAEPVVNMVWAVESIPDPTIKMNLKNYAAQVRWQRSQAGITLPDGVQIDTSDESQTKIAQAWLILQQGWVSSIRFKAESGWVDLDFPAMTAIAQAVAGFVQGCFAAESEIAAAVDAGAITSKVEIDTYGWG